MGYGLALARASHNLTRVPTGCSSRATASKDKYPVKAVTSGRRQQAFYGASYRTTAYNSHASCATRSPQVITTRFYECSDDDSHTASAAIT